VLTAWLTFALAEGFSGRRWLVMVLTTLWGLRLCAYLSYRNWGKGEDPRYGKWREASGDNFWIVSLFKVFLLQALFLWVIALVVQVPQMAPQPAHLTVWDGLGAAVWLTGFAFESVADRQLQRFKADPRNKGQVMDRGLWRYSRHPNYFGECLIWWGLFLIAFSVPGGVWTVISPIIITLVLLKMTGVPLTERTTMESRPGYRDYMRRTSTFIPWFPRKEGR
jgi:steroid 5-alpha reductase family enzyme